MVPVIGGHGKRDVLAWVPGRATVARGGESWRWNINWIKGLAGQAGSG